MTEFRDRTTLITGGASGLGRRMALRIARRGGRLSLWDLNEAGLEEVSHEIKALGGSASCVRCDVSDRRAVEKAARELDSPIDILINNAGVVSGASLLDIPDEQIGDVPNTWNTLDWMDETTKLIHYTNGGPWYEDYQDHPHADVWFQARDEMQQATRKSA